MRVLLVSGSLPPLRCGVGDYTLRLARALAELPGVTVGVLSSKGAGTVEQIAIFPVMNAWSLAEAGTLVRTVRQFRPDVLHVQYPTQGYGKGLLPPLIPIISVAMGVRVVRTWHEYPSLGGSLAFLLEVLAPGPYTVVRPDFPSHVNPLMRPLLKGRDGGFIMTASAIPRSCVSEAQRTELRARYTKGKSRLIVFFGFLYRFKGVELLFDIADSARDQIVIAGVDDVDPQYTAYLKQRAEAPDWRGSVAFPGFLSDSATADLLAAADAVVLPFKRGGGLWNSSIHAAMLQRTPVVSTSDEASGLDTVRNIYFAAPGDVTAMRAALNRLAGHRRPPNSGIDKDEWERVALAHLAIYRGRHLPSSSNARLS